MPLVVAATAFFAVGVLLLLHHGWKHAHEDPSHQSGAARELPRSVLFPAVRCRQLQDLEPRELDHTLFLSWDGVCGVAILNVCVGLVCTPMYTPLTAASIHTETDNTGYHRRGHQGVPVNHQEERTQSHKKQSAQAATIVHRISTWLYVWGWGWHVCVIRLHVIRLYVLYTS